MRFVGLTAAAALTLVAAACGTEESFADRDPNGYEACSEYAAYEADGSVVAKVGGRMVVADLARRSATKAIRDAASENLFSDDAADKIAGGNFAMLDADAFEKACRDAGFDF